MIKKQNSGLEGKLQAPIKAESHGGNTISCSLPSPFFSISLLSLLHRVMTHCLNTLKPHSSPVSLLHLHQILQAEDICWSSEDLLLG